jgi:hypothetical protein
MRLAPLLCLGLLVLAPRGAWSQTPGPPPPSCEESVGELYRQLSADGLVTTITAPQWGAQLTALGSKVRTGRHQYDIKKNQAELAEQNITELLEQLRQAQQTITRLKAEAPPPPAN